MSGSLMVRLCYLGILLIAAVGVYGVAAWIVYEIRVWMRHR